MDITQKVGKYGILLLSLVIFNSCCFFCSVEIIITTDVLTAGEQALQYMLILLIFFTC